LLTTEHILLESDDREVPALRDARKVHARVEVRSRLRRGVLQLEIIDYYYLAVRTCSPSTKLEYVLDLRFIDAPPRVARHVAWRWIAASLGGVALATVIVRSDFSATHWWHHYGLALSGGVLAIWVLATWVAAYRSIETVHLSSMHGEATLLEFTGGIGTRRHLRQFIAKLAAHIRLASAARRRTRAEHLRDEMREHARLREIGVLSAEEYESSKARILAQHAPPTRAGASP
jgi:hypothetical protein